MPQNHELLAASAKARFGLLRQLKRNHDCEGAAAANQESVEAAIKFLDTMHCSMPYCVTLNDDGLAVIEFEDRQVGFSGDLTFQSDGVIQCYANQRGATELAWESYDQGTRS
jgi:hypothetical protein